MVEEEPVGHEVAGVQDDRRQHVQEERVRRQRRRNLVKNSGSYLTIHRESFIGQPLIGKIIICNPVSHSKESRNLHRTSLLAEF